jgi:hypothetical protein
VEDGIQMIQLEQQSIDQIRERIHRMSDSELLRYGQAARYMADPKNNHGKPNPSFQVQLNEARFGNADTASCR